MRHGNLYITLALVLGTLSSCDAPAGSQRQVVVQDQSPSGFSTPTNPTNPTTPTPTVNPTNEITVPSDATHCSWADNGQTGFMHSSTHLSLSENRSSAYTACQSSSTPDTMYFQLEEPITDTQVCFIPMYQQGSSSTYLGVPRCLNATDNKRIYTIRMYKDRPGFQNLPINSVMIIKDKSYSFPYPYNSNFPLLAPDAFLECNLQLTHPNFPNSQFCESFISTGHYHFHKF